MWRDKEIQKRQLKKQNKIKVNGEEKLVKQASCAYTGMTRMTLHTSQHLLKD